MTMLNIDNNNMLIFYVLICGFTFTHAKTRRNGGKFQRHIINGL